MNRKPLDNLVESVEISFLVHATEDIDRLLLTVRNIIPKQNVEELEFVIDNMRGYYGNPISKVKTVIRNKSVASELVLNIANSIRFDDKAIFKSDIRQCVDDSGTLYIRLDKQAIFKGDIIFGSSDPIRMKIKLTSKIRDYEEIIKLYGTVGFLGEE